MSMTRRDFLKTAGTLSALASLAGPSVIAGTNEFSGLKFSYWSMQATQNPQVTKVWKQIIKEFEGETGAKVSFTPVTPEDIYGTKFSTAAKTRNLPTLWDTTSRVAFFWPYSKSLNDYIEDSPEIKEKISWALEFERDQQTALPVEKRENRHVPFALWSPGWVGRMDHFEEAGIDPGKEFPPKSIGHWLSLGKRLKEAGVAEYPLAIYGASGDCLDLLFTQLIVSQGVGPDKKPYPFWNGDWRTSNVDDPVYASTLEAMKVAVDMELVSPGTPTYSDENFCDELAMGTKSLGMTDSSNRGLILDRAPNLVENEVIQWGRNFELGSGYTVWNAMQDFVVGKDEYTGAKSDEASRAAFELTKKFLEDKWVTKIALPFGLPTPKTSWDRVTPSPDNYFEFKINEVEKNMVAPKLEPPRWQDLVYGSGPPIMSKFWRGKISGAEASAQLHEECSKILTEQTFPWE